MRNVKILSIKDTIFIVKLILSHINIEFTDQVWDIIVNDIKNYALQIYSKELKEDSLSTDVMVK